MRSGVVSPEAFFALRALYTQFLRVATAIPNSLATCLMESITNLYKFDCVTFEI